MTGTGYFTKNYINITSGSEVSGGFWKTIYDGAPSSISASALLDLTYGHSSASFVAGCAETYINNEKQRVYREMASLLLGDPDSLFSFNSTTYHEVFFYLFKRRIFKDEIKKGGVAINIQTSGTNTLSLTDVGAASSYAVGVAGDEADLYSGSTAIGKVYYNAGIVAFRTGVFMVPDNSTNIYWSGSTTKISELNNVAISGNIDKIVDGLRIRTNQISFINQTNLHSTIYFCRCLNSEFNYSTNPSFVDNDGRIIPTSGTDNQTRSYITKIGLYDINDNLIAVASTSEPVKKSPDTELIFRCRLNF